MPLNDFFGRHGSLIPSDLTLRSCVSLSSMSGLLEFREKADVQWLQLDVRAVPERRLT